MAVTVVQHVLRGQGGAVHQLLLLRLGVGGERGGEGGGDKGHGEAGTNHGGCLLMEMPHSALYEGVTTVSSGAVAFPRRAWQPAAELLRSRRPSRYAAGRVAMSMTKRYFTSLDTTRS